MDNEKIEAWAENLTKEVYLEWKNKHSFWKQGFKVFYSPVRANPKIIILGYNPGGNELSFTSDKNKFENGDFSMPNTHEYFDKNYLLAQKMRNFFEQDSNLLNNGVKINLIFFRSKNIKEWNLNPHRIKMEKFCFNKLVEIINVLKPKIILVEGIKTYDILKTILGGFKNESNIQRKHSRLISISNWKNILMFGIVHPSGARISSADWQKIKSNFYEQIREFM